MEHRTRVIWEAPRASGSVAGSASGSAAGSGATPYAGVEPQLRAALAERPKIALSLAAEASAPDACDAVRTDPEVHLRVGRPLDPHPPARGWWVALAPWEFGAMLRSWYEPLRFGADEVWVHAETQRRCLAAAGVPAAKLHVLPHGVRPALLAPPRPFPLATRKAVRLLFVGRTDRDAGIDLLLEAYLAAFRASDDVCLVVHDPTARPADPAEGHARYIHELCARPDTPAIELVAAPLAPDTLRDLFHACHALVHPHRTERTGAVMIEAMACGLPVLAPDAGDGEDFVPADTTVPLPGRWIDSGATRIAGLETMGPVRWFEVDGRTLRDRLREVYEDAGRFRVIAERGRRLARVERTWEAVARQAARRLHALATGDRAPLRADAAAQHALRLEAGVRCWDRGERAAAVRHFVKAAAIERTPDALFNLGAALLESGDARAALPYLEALCGAPASGASVSGARRAGSGADMRPADTATRTGAPNPPCADAAGSSARAVEPPTADADARRLLAACLAALGRVDEARAALEARPGGAPDEAAARPERGGPTAASDAACRAAGARAAAAGPDTKFRAACARATHATPTCTVSRAPSPATADAVRHATSHDASPAAPVVATSIACADAPPARGPSAEPAEPSRASSATPRTAPTGAARPAASAETPLRIRWVGAAFSASGFASDTRTFLLGLAHAGSYDIGLEPLDPVSDRGLAAPADYAALEAMARTRFDGAPDLEVQQVPVALAKPPRAPLSVLRTTFESDRIADDRVDAFNRFTEIWVTSTFNAETFARCGVVPEKLRVIPNAIDTRVFDPARARRRAIRGADGFRFLSVFDFTPRKGWELLLRAYLEEFGPADDVSLVLKIHRTQRDIDPETRLRAFFDDAGCARPPRIITLRDPLADAAMAELYASCDAFVLPSRGEGFGRPYLEALAMGLPTIATRWSGHLDFLTDDNAFLVEIDGLEPCERAWPDSPLYAGHRWAAPDLDSLRRQMRHLFEHREEAARRARAARPALVHRFGHDAVGRQVAAAIRQVVAG